EACKPAARTRVHPACARTIIPTTTAPTCAIRTATRSASSATRSKDDRAIQGLLAAWLNQLSETQGVSIGPWDRLRFSECARGSERLRRTAEARRAVGTGAVARRQIHLRPEHQADRRLPGAEREERPR